MIPVNQSATVLLGRLLKQASRSLLAADIDGLRASRLRLLTEVPPQGLRITELADRLGMSKQACGQLVTDLVRSGHLVSTRPADDRRSRLVQVTRTGQRAVAASRRKLTEVDQRWADQVGAERFATFLEVLAELGDPARAPEPAGHEQPGDERGPDRR